MTLPTTIAALDAHWAASFGCAPDDLHRERTIIVPHHGDLADYQGVFTLRRGLCCIISVPPPYIATATAAFVGRLPQEIFEPDTLARAFAPAVERIIGPAWLGVADSSDVRAIDAAGVRRLAHGDLAALRALQAACDPTDWQHSAIEEQHDPIFGYFHDGLLVAAGSCPRRGEVLREVGIITHPAYRGRGFVRSVVGAMTQYGLAERCVMRYRTLLANTPSMRIARSLGYQDDALTIAIRLTP